MGDVAVEFGATTLLQGVSFALPEGACWGVVGRNGAGKTTLFRLMTRELAPTRGSVSVMPGLRIALLDQHRDFGAAATVWQAAAAGYAEAMELETSIARQAERLADLGDRVTEADLVAFGRDQDRMAHLGGWDFHARVDAVLQGLGFDPEESLTRPLSTLSGGERGRVGLAAPLAAPADLLLLDEPTNHLDLDTTRWLTRYLRDLGETIVVVSHDRAFLDETVDHVLHVHAGTVASYRGGYSAFVTQRAERELTAQRAYQKQRVQIEKEEDYIRRNIAGQNSAQAKGRRARLNRLPRLSAPPGEAGAMSLRLDSGERGGDQVLQAESVRVVAGDKLLVEQCTLTAMRGDVIALTGSNGAGKSTLLATLLGARAPDRGTVRMGGSITPAWYRQDLAGVPLDRAIYDVIQDLRPRWTRGQIQGHLGAFGFSGDEVRRSTTTLSGGERARVALAMITLSGANLLVLDEPTNHLDVESIEVLEDALDDYEGTVLLVSHDRAFLRELATRVWWFDGTRVKDFSGTFVEWEAMQAEREREAAMATAAAAAASGSFPRRQVPPRRDVSVSAESVRRRREEAEQRAVAAESRVRELETALADGALYQGDAEGASRAAGLARDLAAARAALDEALAAWQDAENEP